MTPSLRGLTLAFCLAAGPTLAASITVKVPAATQVRLGVVTAPLTAVRKTASVNAFARAVDPVPLATLDSDIAAAAAALGASQAEASRTRTLSADQTVSRKAAEAAAAQARTDAVRLALLRRRLGLEWGPSLQSMSDARRGRLIGDIAAGRAALVRIDSSAGVSHLKGSATIDLGPAGRAHAVILGPARVGDPRLQSTGLLALVSGPQAMQLASGAVAPATLGAGAETAGVMLPRVALLRTAGRTFVYVRRDAGSFERRPVVGGQPDSAGLFVAQGFRAGEPVVIKGAAQLFAAETPAEPQ